MRKSRGKKRIDEFIYQKEAESSIDTTNYIIQNGSSTMGNLLIKVGSWPKFNNIEESEKAKYKNDIEWRKSSILSKEPSGPHTNNFIDNNPARVVEIELFLNSICNEAADNGHHDEKWDK